MTKYYIQWSGRRWMLLNDPDSTFDPPPNGSFQIRNERLRAVTTASQKRSSKDGSLASELRKRLVTLNAAFERGVATRPSDFLERLNLAQQKQLVDGSLQKPVNPEFFNRVLPSSIEHLHGLYVDAWEGILNKEILGTGMAISVVALDGPTPVEVLGNGMAIGVVALEQSLLAALGMDYGPTPVGDLLSCLASILQNVSSSTVARN